MTLFPQHTDLRYTIVMIFEANTAIISLCIYNDSYKVDILWL